MHSIENEVSYQATNSYSTLNNLSSTTKNVWVVCHGIGYLSRYFLKYFDILKSDENYVIALQAPSKYYIGTNYKHVGASWLTKENTQKETQNVMRYFDAVLKREKIPNDINLIVLGYSQGVSIASRYVARKKLNCNHLVLLSGRIPRELEPQNFNFLTKETKISLIYGDQDEYLNEKMMIEERRLFHDLFGHTNASIICFEGKHEVKKDIIKNLV